MARAARSRRRSPIKDGNADIAVKLTEPPDGILANLLNIEGRPEIALTVTGQGPVTSLVTRMTLDAGGQRALEGAATIAQADAGMEVQADLAGPVGTLVAPPIGPSSATTPL